MCFYMKNNNIVTVEDNEYKNIKIINQTAVISCCVDRVGRCVDRVGRCVGRFGHQVVRFGHRIECLGRQLVVWDIGLSV